MQKKIQDLTRAELGVSVGHRLWQYTAMAAVVHLMSNKLYGGTDLQELCILQETAPMLGGEQNNRGQGDPARNPPAENGRTRNQGPGDSSSSHFVHFDTEQNPIENRRTTRGQCKTGMERRPRVQQQRQRSKKLPDEQRRSASQTTPIRTGASKHSSKTKNAYGHHPTKNEKPT